MSIMPDYYENRFELMIFDDFNIIDDVGEKKKENIKKASKLEKREVEKNGICQGCENKKGKLRWVRDGEFYSCYACFIHDLDCEADVMVPMRRVDDMKDYINENEWDELWEMDK